MCDATAFRDGEAHEHGGTIYFASPSLIEPELGKRSIRMRRLPRDEHGRVDMSSITGTDIATELIGDGPVLVHRSATDLPVTLTFREEKLSDNLDLPTSNERVLLGSEAELPMAYAKGPPLLPPDDGGVPVHSTLTDALAAAATSPTLGARGIIYASSAGDQFESYRQLQTAARRLLGALQGAGVVRGDRAVFQCTHDDRQLHVQAIWGCALGGFTFVTLTPP